MAKALIGGGVLVALIVVGVIVWRVLASRKKDAAKPVITAGP